MTASRLRSTIFFCLLALPTVAHAGAWTRDQGHFYLNLNYSNITANAFHSPFGTVPINPYSQNLLSFYGEVGILTRWLTATVDANLFRRNELKDKGATQGFGDMRVGLWTGLITKPVRFSFGLTLGIPTGDPLPSAGPNADATAQETAASLPTGDGEWDVEGRFALGYSFGGVRRWPVQQYLVAEAGYWLRTNRIRDSFVYRLELGTKFPYKFIQRFWFIWRIYGVESFASNAEATSSFSGLGNGVTYLAGAVEVYGQIWRGLGAALSYESATHARSVPAAGSVRATISYQW